MKSSALEFFTAFVGKDKDAGGPSSALVTRHFLKEAAACLYDSKAEVRQDAQLAFQQVYKQVDQELLVHFVCLHQSTGQQRTILQVLFLAAFSYTVTSVAVVAKLSLRSPRKLFIYIIKKFYLQDQSIQKNGGNDFTDCDLDVSLILAPPMYPIGFNRKSFCVQN